MFFHINNHILREMCKIKVDEKEAKKPASYTYNPDTWGYILGVQEDCCGFQANLN